jgi:hypothetical protein
MQDMVNQQIGRSTEPNGEPLIHEIHDARPATATNALASPPHRVYFEGTLPSSSGLGRGPLKAETGVRFP